MAMNETMVEVNGVRLYTRRVGDGPPVVVLHGGPGAHHDYLLPQYDQLARGRALLYYDQRGGGRSPVPRETPRGWRSSPPRRSRRRGARSSSAASPPAWPRRGSFGHGPSSRRPGSLAAIPKGIAASHSRYTSPATFATPPERGR